MPTAAAPIAIESLIGLAVTARCCSEDLNEAADEDLGAMAKRHAIVDKFLTMRSQLSEGQETIRSIRGPFPVFSLHAGRQRGATAHDRTNSVVWLLGTKTHRADDRRNDSYPWLERLHAKGALFPTQGDYERLIRRRNEQAIPVLISRLTAALEAARDASGEPQTVLLPAGVAVTIMALQEPQEEVEVLEQIWLAVDPRGLPPGWLVIIQAALTPDPETGVWQYTSDFPGRSRNSSELRFEFWREVRE